jgi:hypothetical protein
VWKCSASNHPPKAPAFRQPLISRQAFDIDQ